MAFPGRNYAPPNVYTRTLFENPLQGALDSLKIPVFIGEGNEFLSQADLELVRGSSAVVDQRIVGEDETGRAVVSVSKTGVVTRGEFDGELTKFQVRNLPIVTGDGSGTTSNSRSDVTVTINGLPIVVVSVNGALGIVELAQAPKAGDLVRCTYFFNRTDTFATDNVSDQVTPTAAIVRAASGIRDANAPTPGVEVFNLHGDILGATGEVVVPANNVLNLVVDGTAASLTIPPKVDYTAQQVANVISAAQIGTLTGTTFVNNHGDSCLSLNSNHSVVVQDGSANADLGFDAGQASTRRRTFYTFNGPIVDGSDGGVTTTDPAHVTVKVAGKQVIPESVDGATRAVTLKQAPAPGATVTIAYYHNTWQDTFDYLAHVGVTSVVRVGDVPNGSQYNQGADFILQNDRILWGTAATVTSGLTTAGKTLLGESQITPTLIDNRTYLSPCSAVVSSVGGAAVASKVDFQLPLQPTLGNGRDTPLGQSLFQSVSNNRIGLPVNRPDVVRAYWGFSVDDALARGAVTVIKVEGTVITLASEVPVGATVYASFYHNMLVDMPYTLTVQQAGASGVGTYTLADSAGTAVFGASFPVASKSANLTGIIITFPSGSELTPDLHFEGGSGTGFTGPVEETVTVQFANTAATPAVFTVAGPGPYAFINGQSDLVAMTINGQTVFPAAGVDLDNISGHGAGFFAHMVGNEISYPNGGSFVLADFLTGNEQVILTLDGIEATAVRVAAGGVTAAHYVNSINDAVDGSAGVADANNVGAGGGLQTLTDAALFNTAVADYYVGRRVVVGNHAVVGGPTPGSIRTVTAQDDAGSFLTVDAVWGPGLSMQAGIPYRLYNPLTQARIKGATRFNGPADLTVGFRNISIAYNGDASGGAVTLAVTVGAAVYASAADLATAINAQLRGAAGNDPLVPPAGGSVLGVAIAGQAGLQGLDILCTADGDGRLTFALQLPGLDATGYMAFIADAVPASDLCILAGLDTAAAHDGNQAHLNVGQVAKAYQVTVNGLNLHDRIVLRNRILPGSGGSMAPFDAIAQAELKVGAGSGNTKAGLVTGATAEAGSGATVKAPTLLGRIGFGGGVVAATGQPAVTFFDGTGAQPANNVFEFTLDGVSVVVTFVGSANGTVTPLGPASGFGNPNILDQIISALGTLPGTPFGSTWAAITNAGLVRQEGAGVRLTSPSVDLAAGLTIGSGTANSLLGFVEGSVAARTLVSAKQLASAMNSHRDSGSFSNYMWNFATDGAGDAWFATQAVARVVTDSAAREYLQIQSTPTAAGGYGTTSIITLLNASTRSWLRVGTGIDELANAGAVGEAAVNGFFVFSSNPAGSGSANTSILNAGAGQDGIIGQTYRDAVTGLTFTILPRGWHDNPAGPWIAYPAAGTFRINVSATFTTNANLPHNAIPGVELKVANTSDVGVGDTAIVETFARGGEEPAIGDVYYASYVYQKQDFATAFFTKMSAIEAAYGPAHPDNPVSLASYLAIINGAVLIGVKQVPRAAGSNFADLDTYKKAVEELEGVLPGHIKPDLITPLKGDSTQLFQLLSRSNDIQSSIRYRAERTSIVGMKAGSTPKEAQTLAQTLKSARMRVVYPDMALINIEESNGTVKEHLIDGPMLAAMLTGSVVSPNVDVATPWTRRRLIGPTQLARTLDAVEQNQTAQKGVTVLEDKPPFISVRHGLTTDMSTILTKTPTVTLIADHVQQQARQTLEQFIGLKFLPGVLSQIEGRLAMMMQGLVKAQIIAIYTGIKANVSGDDPTVAEVEAFYQPVFPLLYIVLTFHLRSSL